jgi:hypothetical protein
VTVRLNHFIFYTAASSMVTVKLYLLPLLAGFPLGLLFNLENGGSIFL